MRLVLPLPPNRANARLHWRAVHRAKTIYWQRCDNVQLLGEHGIFICPPPPKAPFQSALLAATLYLHQLMDEDNALSRTKWLGDWLVTRRYLVDDTRDRVRWAAIPDQIVDRKNPRISLTIVPT